MNDSEKILLNRKLDLISKTEKWVAYQMSADRAKRERKK
jgi:hypothetical protein